MTIKNQLADFLKSSELSQSNIAKKLGISSATLSQYMQGKYAGAVKTLEKRIKEFLEREENRLKTATLSFVETKTSQKIKQSCQLAFDTQDLVLIIGASGIGKTVSLKDYAQKTENAIYLECDLSHTPKNMLLEIAEKMKIVLEKKDFHSITNAVVKHLSSSDSLLIFDEAELLPHKTLETIRRLHDKSEAAIVLAGMPNLKSNLRGKKGEHQQLFSRIGLVVDCGKTSSNEDLEKIITSNQELIPLKDDLITLAKNNARRLSKIVRGASRLLKSGEKLNSDILKSFSSLLME